LLDVADVIELASVREPSGTIDSMATDRAAAAAGSWSQSDFPAIRCHFAGIDEIINRGDREAFSGLLNAIIEQPGSPVADRVRTLYERVQHRAGDPEFAAWPQYQAAYWLAVAMGQFRTTREDKA
jgi:hypothetical protein